MSLVEDEGVTVLLPMCPCGSAGECREKPTNKTSPSLGFLVNGDDIKRCRVFALGEDAVFPSTGVGLVAYPVEKAPPESLPQVPVMTKLMRPGLSLTGNGTAWVPLTAAETTAASLELCAGVGPIRGIDKQSADVKARTVLARARCIVRHPGLNYYELGRHWGFKSHAQMACEELVALGFARIERRRHKLPNGVFPA